MGIINQKTILDGKLKEVWDFITKPKNFSKYVYGYAYGKITSPNATGIGASYEWYGKLGPFKFKSTEKIIDWEEQKQVAYSGKLFGIKFDSSMNVKKIGEQTLLIVSIEYKVPLYLGGPIIDSLLIKMIIKNHIKKSLYELNEIFKV